MNLQSSNVVPMRPVRGGRAGGRPTVLHAVADDDGLVEVAAVVAALERRTPFRQVVVHASADRKQATGADLTRVDHRLGDRDGSHAERTADMLCRYETVLLDEQPDVVLVSGDEDASLGAALSAAKLGIAIAHLGSGLRSWDWTLSDEINRSVIDRVSDTLFTSSAEAAANLVREGVPEGRIHGVGNTRIDMLRRYETAARRHAAWTRHGARARAYTVVSLQRRASLEPRDRLERIAGALAELSATGPVLMLQHAGTRDALQRDLTTAILAAAGVTCIAPCGYVDTLSLLAGAGAIITDATTVQEDASALGIPCFTLLATSSSPVTLTHGTNVLLGDDPAAITSVRPVDRAPTPAAIPLWDGHSGERVADALVANYTLAPVIAEDL